MAEPQKCPSCGGPPIGETCPDDLIHVRTPPVFGMDMYQCACECGLSGPVCRTKAGAIAQWNMIRMVSPNELADDRALITEFEDFIVEFRGFVTGAIEKAGYGKGDPIHDLRVALAYVNKTAKIAGLR